MIHPIIINKFGKTMKQEDNWTMFMSSVYRNTGTISMPANHILQTPCVARPESYLPKKKSYIPHHQRFRQGIK
jgi:hypothetical protein